MSRDLEIHHLDILRNTLHVGMVSMVVFQLCQVVFLLLSFDLSECDEVSVVFADFGDLWVRHKTQNVTVLSECGSFSQVLCFSCCDCLVFFRSDWVPCSIGALCFVRFVLATALMQKLRIFSASLFAICLLLGEFACLAHLCCQCVSWH